MAELIPAALLAEAEADATPTAPAGDPAATIAVPKLETQPAAINWESDARDLLNFAHELYTPLFPSLALVYTAEVRERIATRAAPVMQKYDLSVAAIMGRWADEIMLAAVVLPLLPATLGAIKHDREKIAAAAAGKQQTAPGPAAEVKDTKTPSDPPSPLDRFGGAPAAT